MLTICVDNIAPWTHCLFLTLFDSCWAKSRVSFRKRCLLSSSCNITKKRKKNVPSPSVLLHFVRDYALASFVNAVHKTKKCATKYSVLVLPDKSAFSLIFSFQHFEACTNTISKIFSWKSQKLFSDIQKTTKGNSLQNTTENHTPNSIFNYNQSIHYYPLMMSQKEEPRKHPWVLPRKVAKMVWI